MNELPEVKRFDLQGEDAYTMEGIDGDYVEYTDYESLRQRLASVENDLKDALDLKELKGPTALGALVAERDELRQRLEESEDKCSAYAQQNEMLEHGLEEMENSVEDLRQINEESTNNLIAANMDRSELKRQLEAAIKQLTTNPIDAVSQRGVAGEAGGTLTLSTKTLQKVAADTCDEVIDFDNPRYVFTPDDLLVFVEALRTSRHLSAKAPEAVPLSDELHYFSFSFVNQGVTACVYIGYPDQIITKSRINQAKTDAEMPADSVLIDCSYLGKMPRETMHGITPATTGEEK